MRWNGFLPTTVFIALLTLGAARIRVRNNGYRGIVVSISANVPESETLLGQLESILTDASAVLFRATKNQLYFKEFLIVLPQSWERKPEYEEATDSVLNQGHILVDIPNAAAGDTPYVLQNRPCGRQGLFIHLTPNYLLNNGMQDMFGPPSKLMVHEWTHFRYGVFDEYARRKKDRFYLFNDRWHPTRCSEEVDGEVINPKGGESCDFDLETGRTDCQFFPFADTKAVSSLMYLQFLDNVVEFCDNATNAPASLKHNRLARNRQNRLCKSKSVWEVMREHRDFRRIADQEPLPSDTDTQPTFRYMQAESRRRVFVLDTSGSMAGERLELMWQTASSFILSSAETGSYLGIVEFSDSATTLLAVRQINSHQDRLDLVNALPTDVGGSTGIGSGLLQGQKELEASGLAKGGTILLVTDGQENMTPTIEKVIPILLEKEVVVNTLSYSQAADINVRALANVTGGRSVFFDGNMNSTSLLDGFQATTTSVNSVPRRRNVIMTILTDTGLVTERTPFYGTFYIDSTIGNQTMVTVTYRGDIQVSVAGPDGSSAETEVQQVSAPIISSKVVNVMMKGLQTPGLWSYNITSNDTTGIIISIQSRPRNEDGAVLKATGWISDQEDTTFRANTTLGVYASVTRGMSPVLNAQVTATIERPDAHPLTLGLYDNGIGTDIIEDDGIYSGNILARDLTGNGRYNIKVNVVGSQGQTRLVVGGSATTSTAFDRRTTGFSETPTTEPSDDFQRVATPGEFLITDFVAGEIPDELPPSRITDLSIESFNSQTLMATLTWTAVGGDQERGQASQYIIYVSDDLETLLLAASVSAGRLAHEHVSRGNLSSPRPSGEGEEYTVAINALAGSSGGTVYLSVAAVDEAGNEGDSSNVVSVSKATQLAVPIFLQVNDGAAGINELYLALGIGGGVVVMTVFGVIIYMTMCRGSSKTQPVI